jgi:hypothetical protein
MLTLAAYRQTGGVRGAVARLAERAWQQLDADKQKVARRILLRLARPGEGEAVVRRRVPLDEFRASEDAPAMRVLWTSLSTSGCSAYGPEQYGGGP